MLVAVLLAGLIVAAPALQRDGIHEVALPSRQNSRATGEIDGPALLSAINNTLSKYCGGSLDLGLPGVKPLQRRQSTIGLVDQVEDTDIDDIYYGSITVGTHGPQLFTVQFDTGSADIFLPGPQCGSPQGCPRYPKYDLRGTDQNRSTTIIYGSGNVVGEDYTDQVTVAGLTATNQGLLSLTQAVGFDTANAGGLLGMGFTSLARSGFTTYFENLIAQGKVATEEFAFYLGREASGTARNSTLTLGGRDTSKFTGNITQVPVIEQGYWQVALDSVQVNGFSAPFTSGQAAIDTGTTVVLAPTAAAYGIFAFIPGAFPIPLASDSAQTIFAYPCDIAAEWIPAIQFAGTSFVIDPNDFNFGVLTQDFADFVGNETLSDLVLNFVEPMCVAAIIGADIEPTENLYVVWDAFLKNWYSIFNYANAGGQPSVSFAKAV